VTEDIRQQIDFEKVPEAQAVSIVNGSPTLLAFKELEQSVRRTNYF